MKKILYVLMVAALAVAMAVANAQPGPMGGPSRPGMRPGMGGPGGGFMQRRMAAHNKAIAQLKLNAKQKRQVKALDKAYAAKMKSLMSGMKPGVRPDRTKFEAARKNYDAKLAKILGAGKKKQYDKIMQKLLPRRGPGGPGGPGGPRRARGQ